MEKSIEQLIIDIEGQGFIGAGPSRLTENPEWKQLKERVTVKIVAPKVPAVLKRKVKK